MIMQFAFPLVIILLMGWNLYRILTGKNDPRFDEPCCNHCRADLREGWDGSMHCHACGQALEQPYGVYFGLKKKPYSKRKMFWMLVLTLVMFLVFNFLFNVIFNYSAGGFSGLDKRQLTRTLYPMLFMMMIFGVVWWFSWIKGGNLPKISQPYCRKCEYDLRVNWQNATQCPECGADLTAEKAIQFGKPAGKRTNKTTQIWSLSLVMVMMSISLGINVYTKWFRRRPAPVPAPVVVPVQAPAPKGP